MELKKDRSIGVIIYYMKNGDPEFLIIRHRQGHWSFAKGHKEKEESDYQTALRDLNSGLELVTFTESQNILKKAHEIILNKKQKC